MKSPPLVLLTIFALSACGTYPVAIPDNPNDYGGKNAPFGNVTTAAGAAKEFEKYYLMYENEKGRKYRNDFVSGEVSFLASIVGVLGGIGKSVEVAATGGGVAAGSGLYSDRYRLKIQAQNYENASLAMRCMYFLTQDISALALSKYVFGDSAIIPAEKNIVNISRKNFLLVYDKLNRLQQTFILGQPDVNKLKEAIKPSSVGPSGGTFTKLLAGADPSADLLSTYDGEMAKCTGIITG